MATPPSESSNVSLVGQHGLGGRPGFKMALNRVGDSWYLYLANFFHSGWTILDVTDPADPDLVRYVEGPDNTMTLQIQVADGLMLTSLEHPREGFGPVDDPMDPDAPAEEGAYLWDVASDPTDPELLAHYETGGDGTHRNFYTGGDYAYMCAHKDEYAGNGGVLTVLDVSDPTDPTEVTDWWWPGQAPGDEEPAEESFYFHGPAYVEDDRAYLSYGRVGPVLLDVADPTEPELLSRMAMGDGLGSWLGTHSFVPLPETDLAAVTTEAIVGMQDVEGPEPMVYTFLVDVSDERQPGFLDDATAVGPRVVSSMPQPTPADHLPDDHYSEKGGSFGPHNLHHSRGEATRLQTGDYLFMTYFNAGLRIFDISDPTLPEEVGHFVPEDPTERVGTRPADALVSHFEDVVVDARGYIYCTDPNHGLFVLEYDDL